VTAGHGLVEAGVGCRGGDVPGERATGGEPVGLEPLLDDLVSVDRVDAQVLNAMPISGS
jgi:hypothetical protein